MIFFILEVGRGTSTEQYSKPTDSDTMDKWDVNTLTSVTHRREKVEIYPSRVMKSGSDEYYLSRTFLLVLWLPFLSILPHDGFILFNK